MATPPNVFVEMEGGDGAAANSYSSVSNRLKGIFKNPIHSTPPEETNQ